MSAKNRGTFVGVWLSDEFYSKLRELAALSGKSQSEALRALIAQKPLPNKSFVKTLNQIAKIGGLIKAKVDSGEHGNAYALGQKVCRIVQEIREKMK